MSHHENEVISAIEAFERCHRVLVTVHDYSGLLRGVVGTDRLQHRHPRCQATRANVEHRCLHFDIDAVQQLPGTVTAELRQCHAGIAEAMVLQRDQYGLDWVLFAGPLREQADEQERLDLLECLRQLAARLQAWCRTHRAWPRAEPVSRGGGGSLPGRAEQIRRWIDVHHREPVSLDDLAQVLGLSRYQTSRVLRQVTGQSWSDLLNAARLRTASALLRQSDLPMIDVAIRSGFNDRAHFHRTFRRHLGCSPRDWRQQLGQQSA